MTPLRVAFVDQVGDIPGGAERTMFEILPHLRPAIAPSLIVFEDGAFADSLRERGFPVDVVPVPHAIGTATRERLGLGAALQLVPVARRIAAIMRERRIEVAYTNSMKAHLLGAVASRLARIPCVMHVHDLVGGPALAALRTAAFFGSRERIACSRLVAASLALPATTIVHSPIDVRAFATLRERAAARAALGIPADELPLVTIVGRINRWKGHDRFLRIAAAVAARTPARFAIVGAPVFRDADVLDELRASAAALGIAERVTFVPWLDDVRDAYAASDVNCNCSTREPFGLTVVEAAACGVPTVCFDDSGAAETIVEGVNGRCVTAGDEGAFASAVTAYLEHADARAAAGASARAAATNFDARAASAVVARVIRRAA